ncbi:MAG: RloB family protein [Clostridia bacterium]|nr:RloB family protein [Clostridia bacterium]
MPVLKTTQKYYFSVEGETEDWYLKWLEDKINNESAAKYNVSIDSRVQKNPLKRAKSMTVFAKTEVTHVCDYESNEDIHTIQFKETLDLLKETKKLGKQIKYNLGYSNFTFELWMVLHKANCNSMFMHRKQYLDSINKAFDENFESLAQYKHETNFKRVLRRINLPDVKDAINRSKAIMKRNIENGLVLQQYKGYKYYRENPSLTIWEAIEKIMKDCELL